MAGVDTHAATHCALRATRPAKPSIRLRLIGVYPSSRTTITRISPGRRLVRNTYTAPYPNQTQTYRPFGPHSRPQPPNQRSQPPAPTPQHVRSRPRTQKKGAGRNRSQRPLLARRGHAPCLLLGGGSAAKLLALSLTPSPPSRRTPCTPAWPRCCRARRWSASWRCRPGSGTASIPARDWSCPTRAPGSR